MGDPDTTLAGWLEHHPPPPERFAQTVAGVSERHRRGEDFFAAVRDLLDEVALLPDDAAREAALTEEPARTADARYDAYLAGLAEHLATAWGLARPVWALEPTRFLERFWFGSPVAGFRPLLLAQSPAAFRRRGIFVSADSLRRV
jgi:hypothetical protein